MKPASSSFALRSFVLVAAFLLPSVSLAQFGDRPLSDEIKRLEDWCKANPKKCEMQEQQARQAQQMRQDTGGAPEKSKGEAAPQLAERFKKADTNSDGKLSREEAEKGMPGVARHFNVIDTNKDGFITRAELEVVQEAGAKRSEEQAKAEAKARIAERFKKADTNRDGKLSREEAEKSLPGIARHFDAIDTNKDGFVTLGELEAAQKAGAEKAAAEKAKSKP